MGKYEKFVGKIAKEASREGIERREGICEQRRRNRRTEGKKSANRGTDRRSGQIKCTRESGDLRQERTDRYGISQRAGWIWTVAVNSTNGRLVNAPSIDEYRRAARQPGGLCLPMRLIRQQSPLSILYDNASNREKRIASRESREGNHTKRISRKESREENHVKRITAPNHRGWCIGDA